MASEADGPRYLHALLLQGPSCSKAEVKTLLQRHHDHLLRTLERSASADQPGGTSKRPAFPSSEPGAPAPSNPTCRAASALLQLDEKATTQLLDRFKLEAYNDLQAITDAAGAAQPTARPLLEPLGAELALLRYAHAQRCLLLRCVHLLLAIAFDSGSHLHAVACGAVALLMQGGLPSRLLALIPTLGRPSAAEVEARLPPRLLGDSEALKTARTIWLAEVERLVSLQAAEERCEVLGLLVLLRYMPLHHTASPESLDPLSDLLTSHSGGSGGVAASGASPALYEMLAGAETAAVASLLATLAPLITRPSAPSALQGADAAAELHACERRAEQLAALVVMAAMHAEKEFCQLHAQPVAARTAAASSRLAATTKALLDLSRASPRGDAAAGTALGALLLTWCVVVLEVETDDKVGVLSAELAVAGEALHGVAWGVDALQARGYRHDDPPDELSSIARELLFDLVAGMLSQQRFRNEAAHGSGTDAESADAAALAASRPADTGWPAHSEQLATLMAAVLEGRPALCHTFWSEAEARPSGALASLLLGSQYPLRANPLPTLLAALCADSDSTARAWGMAHSLQRVCHRVPRQFNLFGVRLHAKGQLRTEVAQAQLGSPALQLPADTNGACVDEAAGDEATMLVEWSLPPEQTLDMAPRLGETVAALLRAGTRASADVQRAAGAALAFLVHAPRAHTQAELWRFMPPLTSLVELLSLCAQLPGPPLERPLLLLCLQLLTTLAPHAPDALAALLQRCPLLCHDSPWLPASDHARHASMLLQMLHVLVVATPPSAEASICPAPLGAALHFVVAHVLPTRGGGAANWQLECKLRALCLLIRVVDDGGVHAAGCVGSDLLAGLLESAAVHSALLEVLGWASGPLQAELARQRHRPIAALDGASDAPSVHAMALVLGAALGLLARLLQAAHMRNHALHAALLAPGAHSGVRCLGLCMLLRGELGEDNAAPAPFLTRCHDAAHLELELAGAPETDAGVTAFLPLCPMEAASIGPLATRCLALMCHVVPSHPHPTALLPHLSQLAAALSCTLGGWLAAVAADGGIAPMFGSDSGGVADCASAALQLLGAAAESQPDLFGALCRGGLRVGETVRAGCSVPEGGWGVVQPAQTGTVRVMEAQAAFVDFEGHRSWVSARPEQLELCAPRGDDAGTVAVAGAGAWEAWETLKPKLEKEAAERPAARDAAALPAPGGTKAEAEAEGPLLPLQRLLDLEGASPESGGADGCELRTLQLQALAVLAEVWRRPSENTFALHVLRDCRSFWAALGRRVQQAPLAEDGQATEERGLAWLGCALSLTILARELAQAVPPRTLSQPAASLLEDVLGWLSGDDSAGAGSIAASVTAAPPAANLENLIKEVQSRAYALGRGALAGVAPSGASSAGRSALPLDCVRLSSSVRLEQLERAGPCEDLPSTLWAGGRRLPLLPHDLPLLDVECLQLRAWRVLEKHLRAAAVNPFAGPAAPSAQALVATEAAAALDEAAERARLGDERAALETGMLLDELPERLNSTALSAPDDAEGTLAMHDALAKAAASTNAAQLAAAAHAAMARSWRELVSLLANRGHLARPVAPAAADGAKAPAWLSGVSSSNALEKLLQARVCELGRQQREWVEQCATARQLKKHGEAISAATELLSQQALALRGGGALAWQAVDSLLARTSWQQRAQQLGSEQQPPGDESAPAGDAAAPSSNGLGTALSASGGGADDRHRERKALHDTGLLALRTLLDDGSQFRRNDAGEGWQLLHKLTTHVRGRLEAIKTKAGLATLSTPAARETISRAAAMLREQDEQLKRLSRGEALPAADASAASLLAQLDALYADLQRDARRLLGLAGTVDALRAAPAAEAQADAACELLDARAASGPTGAMSPRASPARQIVRKNASDNQGDQGAGQLLQRACAAEGGDARQRALGDALTQLACARECLLQQAGALRSAAFAESGPESSDDRVALLEGLTTAPPPPVESAWASVERIHASLSALLRGVAANAPRAEQGVDVELGKVSATLLDEQVEMAAGALGECHLQRCDAARRAAARDLLLSRIECAERLLELLRSMKEDGARPGERTRAAALAVAGAAASLRGSGAPSAAEGGSIKAAAAALQACEEATSARQATAQDGERKDAAQSLEGRAAEVHEVMCVLALALHHERSAPTLSSTLQVKTQGQPSERTFLLSSEGAGTRRLDPHGWFSDAKGQLVERAPAALCSLLWRTARDAAPETSDASTAASWHAHIPAALGSLALCVASRLASRTIADEGGRSSEDAAAMLMSCLQALVGPNRTGGAAASGALSSPDRGRLVHLTVTAFLGLPAQQPQLLPALADSLQGSLLLLLLHERARDAGLAPAQAHLRPLVHRLCAGLASEGTRGDSADRRADVQARLLSLLLPRLPPPADAAAAAAAERLMLHALRGPDHGNELATTALPALLETVSTPWIAEALLQRGLLSRLLAVSAVEGGGAIARYGNHGERTPAHLAWCTSLAIAASALRAAGGTPGRAAALPHAVQFVQCSMARIEVAIAGDPSLAGVLEQHAALRLLEQVSWLARREAVQLRLPELMRQALSSTAPALLRSATELQRAMPPVSSEERTLATLLPSGEPLPRFGPADERAQRGGTLSLPSSSRFSARLRESLQGSLSAAISTLSVPEVRASRPLATVGEETLLTALRAALRSVHQLPAALPRNAVASHCARAALVAAARTCVGVFAGYALQAATVQLDELRRSLAFALGHDRANRGEDKAAGVRRQLQGFARELRRLPQALRGWADDAMDAEAIEDNGTRRQVLSVVAAEVAGLAQAGVAAAEAAASA